jgi:hypothetical protein
MLYNWDFTININACYSWDIVLQVGLDASVDNMQD